MSTVALAELFVPAMFEEVAPEPVVFVQQATLADAPAIAQLVTIFVKRGDLLPRSLLDIQKTIGSWFIGIVDGEIVGIVSLYRYSHQLAEVRSLAVLDKTQKLGLGRLLVQAVIEEAEATGVVTLFALTRVVRFFERMGFELTDIDNFPEKIWTVCKKCPHYDNCDEEAVAISFPHNKK